MLGLGLAVSYAPAMFRQAAEWPHIHHWLTGSAPQPLELSQETGDVVGQHITRIDAGFAALRQRVEGFRPDAVVMLASDTGRLFTRVQIPQFWTYLGEESWGSTRLAELGEKAEEDIVRLRCASELAHFLQREMVEQGFDPNYGKTLRPLGQPDFGMTAALVETARRLMPDLNTPVVPVYVNSQTAPAPSGHRCYAFGTALAQVLGDRTERIALVACGGLSHDHHGPRAGWIDVPFDQWVLDKLSRGKGKVLCPMFDLDSDTLRGGSAEVRLWIIAAGACEALGGKAVVVDYIPAYSAATGIAFAHWPLR